MSSRMTLNFERKMRKLMKNFKFTEVATATDNITLAVIGKLALNGPRSIFKNVTGAEEISFEVEEEDTYESISTIVRSFTLMDGLNLVVVKYHGEECVKKIIDEIFENEMEWHNLDIGGNYLAFARSSYEHKEKSINIKLILPENTDNHTMRHIRKSVHESFKGTVDYEQSLAAIVYSNENENAITQVGLKVNCSAIVNRIEIFNGIKHLVSDVLSRSSGELNEENDENKNEDCR